MAKSNDQYLVGEIRAVDTNHHRFNLMSHDVPHRVRRGDREVIAALSLAALAIELLEPVDVMTGEPGKSGELFRGGYRG